MRSKKDTTPDDAIRYELNWLMDIGDGGEWERIIDEMIHKAVLGATAIDLCDGELAHQVWMLSSLRVALRKIEAAYADIKAAKVGREPPVKPKPESRYKRQLERILSALEREDKPMFERQIRLAGILTGRRHE